MNCSFLSSLATNYARPSPSRWVVTSSYTSDSCSQLNSFRLVSLVASSTKRLRFEPASNSSGIFEIYTYIPTYLHTYIPTYIHPYIHTYRHTYRHTYLHTYLHTYIPTNLHTYTPTYLHTYIPTYLRTYMPTCLHA